MFPKHNGYAVISESFGLNIKNSVPLTNKLLFAPLQYKFKQNFVFSLVKLIEDNFSAANVGSNLCVGPLPRIKISFSYYQYMNMKSYLLQNLLHFFQLHHRLKKILFYQIRYYI